MAADQRKRQPPRYFSSCRAITTRWIWCKRSAEPLAVWWYVSFWLVEGLLDLLVGDVVLAVGAVGVDG